MSHPVVHFEISTKDGERSASFYRQLFGWQLHAADRDYWLVTPEDSGIGGGVMQARDDVPTYVTVYVATASLDETLCRAAALGGMPVVPPTEVPGLGSFAMFQDPHGNVIGLFEEDQEG